MNHSPFFCLFPGQGSQHVGMVKDFYENFAVVRHTFEEASDASRLNVKKLCFDGPESDLTLTANTQPCLLTASVAVFRVLKSELPLNLNLMAGHSLGEYSALVAANALQLATAVRWVRERGLAMQSAVPSGEGTMAAVIGLDDSKINELCAKATRQALLNRDKTGAALTTECIVEPANFNSPGQIVVAGSLDAVEAVESLCQTDTEYSGAKAIRLNVSAPFHCRLMKPARERMREVFETALSNEVPRKLDCAYIANANARIITEPGLILDLLEEQIDHPVLWSQSLQTLIQSQGAGTQGSAQQGDDSQPIVGIECGPGRVLTGLARRNSKRLQMISVSDVKSLKSLEELLTAKKAGNSV